MERSAAVNQVMHVLRNLTLRYCAIMCDLAEGQPIPRNDPQAEEEEVQPQEVQGPVVVSESDDFMCRNLNRIHNCPCQLPR